MANLANNSVSGITALINVQKPSSSAQNQGERKVVPDAPVDETKASGSRQRGNSGNDENNNTKESSFSKLIVSDHKEPLRSATAQRNANNASASPSPAPAAAESDDTSTDETTVTTETTFTSIMFVLIQLHNIPAKNASDLSLDCSTKTDAANDNADQFTGSLEDMITKLLALLEKLGGGKPSSDTTVTQVSVAVVQQVQVTSTTTYIQTDTGTQDTAATDTGSTTDEVDMSEIMAMLQSILQQLGAGKATDAAAPANTAVADATDASAPKIPAGLTDALSKLADLLEQKLQTGKAAKTAPQDAALPAKANAEKATASDIPLPVLPKQEPQSFSNQPERSAFQQALARLSEVLAPKDDSANDITPANTNTPAVTHAPQQNVQDSSFAKIVQQPAQAPAVPVQDQVLVNIKNAVADGLSQIKIQLHPEELGKVEVHITTSADGKAGVSITADNRQTLSMLQNEARALQDALRDIGLKTDAGGLNFNLRDSQQDARNSSKQQQGGYTQVAGVDEIDEPGFSTAGALHRLVVQNGLDIRV